jgi:hypothetical protein
MDITVVLYSCICFLVYLTMQAVIFRFIHPDRALIWLMKLYCLVEGAALIFGLSISGGYSYGGFALWQWSIFSLCTAVYIFCVFSFTEASITLRILREIAGTNSTGITKMNIWKRYNTKTIVGKRISRFILGGDIEKVRGLYKWKKVWSPFIVREKIITCIRLLFGGCQL